MYLYYNTPEYTCQVFFKFFLKNSDEAWGICDPLLLEKIPCRDLYHKLSRQHQQFQNIWNFLCHERLNRLPQGGRRTHQGDLTYMLQSFDMFESIPRIRANCTDSVILLTHNIIDNFIRIFFSHCFMGSAC